MAQKPSKKINKKKSPPKKKQMGAEHIRKGEKYFVRVFLLSLLGWLAAAHLLLLVGDSSANFADHKVLSIIWLLVALDLFFMAKTVARALSLVSEPRVEIRRKELLSTVIWVALKIHALILLGYYLYLEREALMLVKLLGVLTIVIVPFVCGLWWNKWQQTETR